MAGGSQIAFLRALARKNIFSKRLSSLKPSYLRQDFFRGADACESSVFENSFFNFIRRGGIHTLRPLYSYDLPAKNETRLTFIFSSEHNANNSEEENAGNTEALAGIPESDKNSEESFRNSEYCASLKEGGCSSKNGGDVWAPDPKLLFQQMCECTEPPKLSLEETQKFKGVLDCFTWSGWARHKALSLYIKHSVFPIAASGFWTFLVQHCQRDVVEYLLKLGPCDASVKFLFPIFAEFCAKEFEAEINRFSALVGSADLRKPYTWFPFARAMKRKIIYHCGPTNSGKTYNALQSFLQAKSGIYCGPLRLLAMEIFDKVNGLGVYCNLHTGQEKKEIPFANHVSCTVEMASTEKGYEVAVLDEIQMINDESRGYAWSRALLGLRADEVHLCGDPTCLKLVREICAVTGDDLIEKHYGRLKPLVVESKTLLGSFENIEPGDCIVAFSRREIFEVRMAIEKFTKHRCCTIYGALPPETRKQQASLFNNPNNEYDVLVASDAIGMGLNLNIRRVVFYSLQKYNGQRQQNVPASQVKQIAGRAGRRGSQYPEGLTTTFQLKDLDYLIDCLQQPFGECMIAGLFPFFEQVELFAAKFPNISFVQLLETFSQNCQLDASYFLCKHDHIKRVAHMLGRVQGLSLQDRYNFCYAPVNTSDPKAMAHLLQFAQQYSNNLPVRIAVGLPKGSARNDLELLDLETKHQILSMYLWLSTHFGDEKFPFKEKARCMATDIADLLAKSLAKACWKPESRRKRTLPGPEKAFAVRRQYAIMKARTDGLVTC